MRLEELFVSALLSAGLAGSVFAADWDLEPVVLEGDALPGGGQFMQVGEIFPLGERELLFWARNSEDAWALYRWREGQLSFVLPDNTELRVEGLPEPVKVKYAWGGAKVPTLYQFSEGRLFLQARRGATTSDLLVADSTGLHKVLGFGDRIEGVDGPINDVDLLASDAGQALLHLRTKEPEKRSYWAVWDGANLRLALAEGRALAGLDSVRPIKLRAHAIAQAPRPALWRGSVYAVLTVEGAPYKRALFRLDRERSEPLLAEGGGIPAGSDMGGFREAQSISYLGPLWPLGESRFFIELTISGPKRSYIRTLFEYRDGRLHRQLNVEFEEVGQLTALGAYQFELLSAEPPTAIMALLLKHPEKTEDWRGIGLAALLNGEWHALPWLELCCQEDDPNLYGLPARLLNFRYRPAGAGFPGIVVSVSPGALTAPPREPGFHRVKGGGLSWWRYRSPTPQQWVYLDPQEPDTYHPLPEIATDAGPLSLGAVFGWLDAETGIAVVDGGLFLVRRISPMK